MADAAGTGDPQDARHARDLDPATVAALSQVALDTCEALGASHAEVRVERIRSQAVSLRDARLETATDDTVVGMGLRVVHDGVVGFAATVALGSDQAAALATQAVELARTCARAGGGRVEPVPEPPRGTVSWTSPHRVDPVDVPLAGKIDRLAHWSSQLLSHPVADHVAASALAVSEEKHYADLAGTTAFQRRVRVHPQVSAVALTEDGMEELRTLAPPVGRGWEYLDGDGWDWDRELAELPDLLAQKIGAPSVVPGAYDLVIDPTNLWLTIHESIGHATELDRAMGYEAAYAGTSFATLDQVGQLRYGSPLLQVVADRTADHGLSTVAIDDEGVRPQTFDLVRDGLLVGFQLDRITATRAGLGRSNGCAYADSPLHVPIQRMANVSLQPAPGAGPGPTVEELISGVERGIYVVGDKSWSIDMQRRNFQFTGQRFFRIEHGRLAGQLKDVAYQATTTEFWGSMAAVGGRTTYLLCGAFNCGKGQPGQVAPVSHGSPAAVFEGVRVLNTREEGQN